MLTAMVVMSLCLSSIAYGIQALSYRLAKQETLNMHLFELDAIMLLKHKDKRLATSTWTVSNYHKNKILVTYTIGSYCFDYVSLKHPQQNTINEQI